jgi:hypothetical protein
MSEPVALISSSEIEQEELASFLQSLGAVSIEENTCYNMVVSKGHMHVWIALDNRGFNEYEADEIEMLTKKLSSKPQTLISLNISSAIGLVLLITLWAKFSQVRSYLIYVILVVIYGKD